MWNSLIVAVAGGDVPLCVQPEAILHPRCSPDRRKGEAGITLSLVELGSGDAVTDATDENGAQGRWGGGRGNIMNGEMQALQRCAGRHALGCA